MLSSNTTTRLRDVWISLLLYFSVHIIYNYFLTSLSKTFDFLPYDLIIIILNVLPLLISTGFLSYRYGVIRRYDWRIEGEDYVVLLMAFIVLFIFVAIIALAGGGKSDIVSKISRLNGLHYLTAFLIITGIGPILEEFIFRKYIYEIFNAHFKHIMAIICTVVLNGIIHVPTTIIDLTLFIAYSLFFTLIYIKSRLLVSIIVHCALNTFAMIVSR